MDEYPETLLVYARKISHQVKHFLVESNDRDAERGLHLFLLYHTDNIQTAHDPHFE